MLLCYYVIYDICINLQNLIVDLEIEGNMSSLMEDQVIYFQRQFMDFVGIVSD